SHRKSPLSIADILGRDIEAGVIQKAGQPTGVQISKVVRRSAGMAAERILSMTANRSLVSLRRMRRFDSRVLE
ncbi:MAG: hypothetical protein ACE1ZA_02455, partial [Pseudomonadales bacterium]